MPSIPRFSTPARKARAVRRACRNQRRRCGWRPRTRHCSGCRSGRSFGHPEVGIPGSAGCHQHGDQRGRDDDVGDVGRNADRAVHAVGARPARLATNTPANSPADNPPAWRSRCRCRIARRHVEAYVLTARDLDRAGQPGESARESSETRRLRARIGTPVRRVKYVRAEGGCRNRKHAGTERGPFRQGQAQRKRPTR